jgi:uncharacterized membrane protein YidH (DUF202 family)
MTQSPAVEARRLEQKGAGRIGIGAGLGFAGALCAIVLPLAFLLIVADDPGGFFVFSSSLVEVTSVLVLVGAILLLLSLFFYRRSFAALRKVDPRFYTASILCIVGSLGFLLLLVAAAVVVGNSAALLACAHGQPSHALTCLTSGQPFGAITGALGFIFGWFGGLGIVIGLSLAGSRFRAGALSGAAALYLLLLLILLVPFLGLIVTIPDLGILLLVAPVFAIIAPALALAGSNRTRAALGAA